MLGLVQGFPSELAASVESAKAGLCRGAHEQLKLAGAVDRADAITAAGLRAVCAAVTPLVGQLYQRLQLLNTAAKTFDTKVAAAAEAVEAVRTAEAGSAGCYEAAAAAQAAQLQRMQAHAEVVPLRRAVAGLLQQPLKEALNALTDVLAINDNAMGRNEYRRSRQLEALLSSQAASAAAPAAALAPAQAAAMQSTQAGRRAGRQPTNT